MTDPLPPGDSPTAARVVGVIYLTACAGFGGGVFLFWHPQSIYCRAALGVALVTGLVVALIARIDDPAARPIRWGLLWIALGFVAGPCLVFGVMYLVFKAAGHL
jgi:hypothetical protein